MQFKTTDLDITGSEIMIFKLFDTIFIIKEYFQVFGKIFKKILKMDEVHLFSPNYVCILMANETK